ncbi:hypothetical protein ACINK0_16015 [Deinococcus sp. VB343]|uniref:Uncharacterized protein n=1 Tax=Deinococcus sp. VB142 TaxID=3112952 RepID=A0AAU6Q8J6_9DEIO
MLDPVFIAQVLTEDGLIVLDETVHGTYEDAAKSVLPLAAQHTHDEDVERQLLTPTERPLETLARLNEAGLTELTADAITLDFPDEITLHGCLPLSGQSPVQARPYNFTAAPDHLTIALEGNARIVLKLVEGKPVVELYDAGERGPRSRTVLSLTPEDKPAPPQVQVYLRKQAFSMTVHPNADFSDYQTVLEHVAVGLAPHLPDRVTAILVDPQQGTRYVTSSGNERYNVPALDDLPLELHPRFQAIREHHQLGEAEHGS